MDAETLATQINGKKWIKIGRWIQAPLFAYSNITGRARKFNNKTLGFNFEFENFLFLGHEYQFEANDFAAMKGFFVDSIRKDKFWFRTYEKIVKRVSNDMIANSKRYMNMSFEKCSDQELKDAFCTFYNAVNVAQPVLEGYQLVGELLEELVRADLAKWLDENNKDRKFTDEYIKDLNIPKKRIATVQEADDLLEVAAKIQRKKLSFGSREAQKILLPHLQKYAWLNTHHFIGDPFDYAPTKQRLKTLLREDCASKIKKISELRKTQQERLKKLKAELKSQKNLIAFIDMAQDLSYLKPYRVDAYYIAWVNFFPLFAEIGKRANISIPDIMCLTDKEIENVILKKEVDKRMIEERKKEFAIVKIDGKLDIISGEFLSTLRKKLVRENYSGFVEVKGTMAFKGIVKGKARVLHSEEDISEMKKGEILVISMTDPNYILAMEKASAFVTDFGGMLCHAAIIAREMEKPCVIGTNIATKVFKSGDILEVDANKGVVRKISM